MIRCEQVNGFLVTGHCVDIYIGVRQMTKACGKRYFDNFCESHGWGWGGILGDI